MFECPKVASLYVLHFCKVAPSNFLLFHLELPRGWLILLLWLQVYFVIQYRFSPFRPIGLVIHVAFACVKTLIRLALYLSHARPSHSFRTPFYTFHNSFAIPYTDLIKGTVAL